MTGLSSIVYGPVPSRRLNRSLGVNNIPPKVCSYDCAYCQVGKTTIKTISQETFYKPQKVYELVKTKIAIAKEKNLQIDYVTFVPDGEPTLDKNLGESIRRIKDLGVRIAVITNGSLLWLETVSQALSQADYVSIKLDAVQLSTWKRINCPNPRLDLLKILSGVQKFAEAYAGTLVTETMLIDKIPYEKEIPLIAHYLQSLKTLNKAYLAIPTRPPSKSWVQPASETVVNSAFQCFSEHIGENRVSLLINYEGDVFNTTGEIQKDLLSITAVHPMRKSAVEKMLTETGYTWDIVEKLIAQNLLVAIHYRNELYYLRKYPTKRGTAYLAGSSI